MARFESGSAIASASAGPSDVVTIRFRWVAQSIRNSLFPARQSHWPRRRRRSFLTTETAPSARGHWTAGAPTSSR